MFCSFDAALDELGEVDVGALTDGELDDAVRAFERAHARLEAVGARLLRVWDGRGCWRAAGARTGAAWLAAECRLPRQDASRQLRTARGVAHLPAADAAWAAGGITGAHVRRLLRARNGRTTEQLASDEPALVGAARASSFASFDRAMAVWSDVADPDGSDQDAQDRRDRRQFHLSESIDGMWFGDLTVDPISGSIVDAELRRIEADLFLADRAEAKERLAIEEPGVGDLRQTPAQRRADALVEMATRSATAPADGKRPAPLFTVLVGYETFAGRICQLSSASPVAPGAIRGWLDDALVERVVFDAPGHVAEVSSQRFFTGALRRAIQVRDQTCFHPTCEEPADRCQVDHIQPAGWQGPTTQQNGRLACGFHNRLRHRRPVQAPAAAGRPAEPP